jgi:short-subunit dehydrogenase
MNVVITGASRGLGFAMAEKFASGGHALILCSQNEQRLMAAAEDLRKRFPSIVVQTKAADLSVKSGVQQFGNWILEQKIETDVLINNAGSFVPGSVHEEPEGALEEMIAVNLYSAYHLTRILLPGMKERKRGHIFNMCSIASLKAYNNGGAYSISKFALLGFTKNLREEMKPHNIKVTAILPGAAYTDSWKSSGVSEQRLMEANDIADMVYAASLLSPQACVEEILLRPQLGDL